MMMTMLYVYVEQHKVLICSMVLE